MVNFNGAVKKARELEAEHGLVHEWTKAYVFALPEEMNGIGASPCVILKDCGEAIYFTDWLISDERAESEYVCSYRLAVDGTWDKFKDPEYEE